MFNLSSLSHGALRVFGLNPCGRTWGRSSLAVAPRQDTAPACRSPLRSDEVREDLIPRVWARILAGRELGHASEDPVRYTMRACDIA